MPDLDLHLDSADMALLAALRDDGRATVQALAEQIGLSTAATSVRLGRLRERGAIRGIHADIDERLLGYDLCAYLLLRVQEIGDRHRFTDRIARLPEVTQVAWVTGEHDVLVTCWVRDRRHLEAVIESVIREGARSTTMLVLGEVIRKAGIRFEEPPTSARDRPDDDGAPSG